MKLHRSEKPVDGIFEDISADRRMIFVVGRKDSAVFFGVKYYAERRQRQLKKRIACWSLDEKRGMC